MACPQVAGGRDDMQVWRVANRLNNVSRTAENGWSSRLGGELMADRNVTSMLRNVIQGLLRMYMLREVSFVLVFRLKVAVDYLTTLFNSQGYFVPLVLR
jgi:hypothetical protein